MKKSKQKKKEKNGKEKQKGCPFVAVLPKEETGKVWGHRLHSTAFKPGGWQIIDRFLNGRQTPFLLLASTMDGNLSPHD